MLKFSSWFLNQKLKHQGVFTFITVKADNKLHPAIAVILSVAFE